MKWPVIALRQAHLRGRGLWAGRAPSAGTHAAPAAAQDRWRAETGELQYRLLWYPQRAYFVVLMGSDRDAARYLGCLDANWRLVHDVELPGGGSTASLLRALPKF